MNLIPLKSLVFPAALAAGLFAAGCSKSEKPPSSAPKPSQTLNIQVATVAATNTDREISIVGTLYSKDEAAVSAEVEGGIEDTTVEFGDRVKEGQELAYIDTSLYKALLDQAEGNLAKAQANKANATQNLRRVRELNQSGISSRSDLDQAEAQAGQWEAEVKAAQAALAVAKLNLSRSKVKAPFDGAVAQRIVGKGDFVKVGSPLFQVVNDATLKFIFQVPEKYASLVQKELPVKFSVDNYPGETFTGEVYLISPRVLLGSRGFNVGALVPNAAYKLKANTFARGSLVLQRNVSTVVVPLDAVITFAGVTKAFVIEGGKARSQPVETGRVMGGSQEILSGLKPGDVVAVTGLSKLHDGLAVSAQGKPVASAETGNAPGKSNRSAP